METRITNAPGTVTLLQLCMKTRNHKLLRFALEPGYTGGPLKITDGSFGISMGPADFRASGSPAPRKKWADLFEEAEETPLTITNLKVTRRSVDDLSGGTVARNAAAAGCRPSLDCSLR